VSIVEQVRELRERTGCGVIDCRTALAEAGNDLERAIELLRAKGIIKVAKKAGRSVTEGIIASYVHTNSKIGVLVSLKCETDFVARTPQFQSLARDLALHIAAVDPAVVAPEDVPNDLLDRERKVAEAQAARGKKPAAIQAKIVAGKLANFRAEHALLTQPFVRDPKRTVGDRIAEAIQELGEKITVSQFCRLSL